MIFNRRWHAFDELELEEHLKRGSLNERTVYHESASNPESQGWIRLAKVSLELELRRILGIILRCVR